MKTIMVRCTANIAVVVALYLEACAIMAAPRDIALRGAPRSAAVTVSNMTTLSVRIYLHRAPVDVELGTVQGLSSRTFEVNSRFLADAGELQLEARDRRGVALRSDTFTFGAKRVASWQFGARSIRLDVR